MVVPNLTKPETEMPKSPAAPMPVQPAARPPVAPGRPESNASIIAPDLIVSGNLISKGEVRIEGEVQGDTFASHIVVGEGARVTGAVIADEVIVRGQVMGSVRGKRVLLQATSHIEGDVHHKSLALEQGAFFEGKSQRSEDPLAGIIRPAV